MARAALQLSLHDLAAASSVSRMTCARFEGGKQVAPGSVDTMRAALEGAGASFTDDGKKIGVAIPR